MIGSPDGVSGGEKSARASAAVGRATLGRPVGVGWAWVVAGATKALAAPTAAPLRKLRRAAISFSLGLDLVTYAPPRELPRIILQGACKRFRVRRARVLSRFDARGFCRPTWIP